MSEPPRAHRPVGPGEPAPAGVSTGGDAAGAPAPLERTVAGALDPAGLPERQVLTLSTLRLAAMVVAMGMFAVIGILMLRDPNANTWVGALVTGAALAAGVLVPVAARRWQRPALLLERDGFTVRTLVGARRWRWDAVSSFAAFGRGQSRRVIFTPGAEAPDPGPLVARSLGIYPNALPTGLGGLPADVLAALLNAWRARALGGGEAHGAPSS